MRAFLMCRAGYHEARASDYSCFRYIFYYRYTLILMISRCTLNIFLKVLSNILTIVDYILVDISLKLTRMKPWNPASFIYNKTYDNIYHYKPLLIY